MASHRLTLAGVLLIQAGAALAAEVPPPAYQLAAQAAGIPAAALYALALQESKVWLRRQWRPWPWTLNVAGRSLYFANRRAACAALLSALGTHSAYRVDAGLGQINLGWHGKRFATPCAALDPHLNLAEAADILKAQHALTGDWVSAAGRYHRPAGGAAAARYRAAFQRQLARIAGAEPLLLAGGRP